MFKVVVPDVSREMRRAKDRHLTDLRRASIVAVHRASLEGVDTVKSRMRARRLGKLDGAVGHTSTLKKGDDGRDPYGVMFARGGDDSLAGGALDAYSQGVTIRAANKNWLAFQTNVLPRRIGRKRLTPERYRTMGLAGRFGPLKFVRLSPDRAVLLIENVKISAKTGRARPGNGRKSRGSIEQKAVVAFVLIRSTMRAKRFDKDLLMLASARKVPDYILFALRQIQGGRA